MLLEEKNVLVTLAAISKYLRQRQKQEGFVHGIHHGSEVMVGGDPGVTLHLQAEAEEGECWCRTLVRLGLQSV